MSGEQFDLERLNADHLEKLLILNDCQRLFSMKKIATLKRHAILLNKSDKLLIKQDLSQLNPRWIYNVILTRLIIFFYFFFVVVVVIDQKIFDSI